MRIKNFSAVEKHFQRKESKYKSQIQQLTEVISDLKFTNKSLVEEITKLQSENKRLNDWIDRLLTYTELTPEQINEIIGTGKRKDNILKNLSRVSKFI